MEAVNDLADYPDELVEHALLDDGTEVVVRPLRPDDGPRLERLFYRLSPQALYRRFFAPVTKPDAAVIDRLVHLDYVDRLALAAIVGDEVVGVARYDRLGSGDEAELAVIVEDAWQGRGLATRLLWRLTAAARARGIRAFVGVVLGENRPMMGLLHVLGDDVTSKLSGGEYEVRIGLAGVRSDD